MKRYRLSPMPRDGAALLEVIVAVTILALAALGLVVFANQASASLRRSYEAEHELRRASDFLEAVALWPREDLDRHLGDRREGEWWLFVARPLSTLYTVELRDSLGVRVLLRTALFRTEPGIEEDRRVPR